MTSRRNIALRRWILFAPLAIALAYPLSLGPVCWTMSRLQVEMRHPRIALFVSQAYSPLAPLIVNGPRPVQTMFKGWMGFGMPSGTTFHDNWTGGVGWSKPAYTYTLWQY